MTAGTVTKWLVRPGDVVKRGDVVVEVETDKAAMEVEIFEGGTISKLLVPEGEKVPVGTALALVEAAAPAGAVTETMAPVAAPKIETVTARAQAAEPPPRATPTARVVAHRLGVDLATVAGTGVDGCITRADVEHAALKRTPTPAPREPAARRLLVSPRAQRLAREHGIEISTMTGSGPGGSITGADIEKAIAAPAPAPATASVQPPTAGPAPAAQAAKRGPIVQLMERANREVPHYYLGTDIDMSGALAWLAAENAKRPVTERVLYAALLLKATAMAAHDVPEVNGYWIDGEFQPSKEVNLGVAISIRSGGLVAPAIADAGNKPLAQLMAELTDLVQRARAGRLRASEMTSGTITVTNLGEQGVGYVFGVIYPPQVALVGFGRISERPWASNGMVGARPVITVTLAADHRASDGHRGGRFLAAISHLLQEPEHL